MRVLSQHHVCYSNACSSTHQQQGVDVPQDRSVNKRTTSTVIQDRDSQLAAEANEWARAEVRKFFSTNKVGFFTPADVMQQLDEREDAPTAWLRWMSSYPTRYQMVRNACVAMHKREFLESRQEKNALGKDATSYQRARDLDDWQVTVKGGDVASVIDIVTGWLRSNPKALRGVAAIDITRKSKHSSESTSQRDGALSAVTQRKPAGSPRGHPVARIRSR